MNIELINTGSELLLGRTLNTHAQWLGRQLADHGWAVARQVTVADTSAEIAAAVREALGRAEVVITTGGLGPTSDDATRETIAQLLGKKLVEDPAIRKQLEQFFIIRHRLMPASNLVQALVPEGAMVLPNPNGTAPGLAMEINENGKKWLFMLPGPPRELRPMFTETVLPQLAKSFPAGKEFFSRTLRTTGLGESALAEKISKPLQPFVGRGLELGYCAHTGQVDVRLAARGAGGMEIVRAAETAVRDLLGEFIFGEGDESLEAVVLRLLADRQQTLVLAESCTGGFITHQLTNVPGASAVLLAGLVTYANAAKEKFLGVRAETLAQHGAVSEAVAREMAAGARRETGADYALAVTGIAGPAGGTADKPVGTVFLALASAAGTVVERRLNRYERATFKELTARQALELLRRTILEIKNPPA